MWETGLLRTNNDPRKRDQKHRPRKLTGGARDVATYPPEGPPRQRECEENGRHGDDEGNEEGGRPERERNQGR